MSEVVKTDRRILRTKQAITTAFLELFAKKDFEQITINEIADRANVNRGTVYLHFSDKYELLDKCMESHIQELISLCQSQDTGPIQPGVIRDPKPFFDYVQEHYAFLSALFSNQRAFVFRDRLLHYIASSLTAKLERPDRAIDKEVNAQFMASAFIGVVEWWIRHQMPHSTKYMADQVHHLFSHSQGSPPADTRN
ncbi:TetR/AcrR family transcriptional regulator [Paenibacillus koleovorans]|uniref:TetR/AcrR family transcriptional regulator n=1 Tax=Paenibacillus koleovorans TaxID=121608 RepID=UPI000FDBF623|nr:TetR/AcrR family transcriptional regulator [Paenibacillus koleovorans]